MEVDEIQTQVCKFQRICSSDNDNSPNPNKIATQKPDHHGGGGAVVVGGGGGRICGWPSSRIVRVSRASGGKDRHSKVLTSKGLRDRRVRLSVTTAIQFYDLQDRLGYDQPSKAVEWLIKAASSSINELPSLDPSFSGVDCDQNHHRKIKKATGNCTEFEDLKTHQRNNDNELPSLDPSFSGVDCDRNHHRKIKEATVNCTEFENNNVCVSKSCSSTSETSKGSGISLTRSENRIRARERAREMAAKKDPNRGINGISQNSSFTDLLTGGAVSSNNTAAVTPMDYFFGHPQHHFSFLQDNFSAGGGGNGGGFIPGFNRGTLQSNLLSVLPHQLQRFQSSTMVDGSSSTNFPFFVAPTIGSAVPENFSAGGGYGYGGGDGGRTHSDHRKEKSKN